MSVRVLCTGDIHIGRRLGRVSNEYRTADAWNAIVDLAIREEVDLLALSGDVIDKASKSYEALGPMQAGLAKLDEVGIETVAVAGNHDHDVLERLVGIAGTDRFHFLGRKGTWERFTLTSEGAPVLHVDGWSFPFEHTSDPPLRTYTPHARDDVPVMGLLHGDVDVPASSYGPISLSELWALPWQFTLLGHIHAPAVFEGHAGKKALYPGSPWALDPGEPGVHGVWMVTFDSGGLVDVRHMPISPVQYGRLDIDLTGISDQSAFQQKLVDELRIAARDAASRPEDHALSVLSLRLELVGRSPVHREISGWIDLVQRDMAQFPVDSITVEIDRVTSSVRPPIELERLAEGSDPVAETAKLILALHADSPDQEYRDLVALTHEDMKGIYNHAHYAGLRVRETKDTEPTEDDARALLSERAWEVISVLVAQKEGE